MGRIEGPTSVHHAAVVPIHEFVRLPSVTVNPLRFNQLIVDLVNKRLAYSIVHADHGFGMVTQVHAPSSRLRVRTNERVFNRRHGPLLFFGQWLMRMITRARVIETVHHMQGFVVISSCLVEFVLGTIHITNFGFTTTRRDFD